MMWASDLDSLALLAEERHAEMLAQSMLQQQLHGLLSRREHRPRVWHWLRHMLRLLPPANPMEAAATRR